MLAPLDDGLVIRSLGGFVFVYSKNVTYRCVTRGTLKKREDIIVGDRVRFAIEGEGLGVVEELLPRTNRLLRPPIANIDQVLVVFTPAEPSPNLLFIDRIVVQAEDVGIDIVICLNKSDLLDDIVQADELLAPYRLAGYDTLTISSRTGDNLPALKARLRRSISVFAGQSGVGKSSLLNCLLPDIELDVGAVSERTLRGRHTTRQVELLPLPEEGWVADTPGFSTLELPDIEVDDLAYLFPEFEHLVPDCRFSGCRHETEPGCAVRDAVAAGLASSQRYESYLIMARELREARRKW